VANIGQMLDWKLLADSKTRRAGLLHQLLLEMAGHLVEKVCHAEMPEVLQFLLLERPHQVRQFELLATERFCHATGALLAELVEQGSHSIAYPARA